MDILLKAILTILFVYFSVWLGTLTGLYYKKKLGTEVDHQAIGSVVGAALGLLAFMLAFTFQLTSNRYDNRKELFREELIAVKNVYLQAQLLKDSTRIPVREMIKRYVGYHLRVEKRMSDEEIYSLLDSFKIMQNKIWSYAVALSQEDRSSEIYSLFTNSVTDMIDYFDKRVVVGAYVKIPSVVFYVLYIMSFFAMMVLGFQFGITGKRNTLVVLTLGVIFAAVMWLIFALDSPRAGLVRVNQTQLHELKKDLDMGRF